MTWTSQSARSSNNWSPRSAACYSGIVSRSRAGRRAPRLRPDALVRPGGSGRHHHGRPRSVRRLGSLAARSRPGSRTDRSGAGPCTGDREHRSWPDCLRPSDLLVALEALPALLRGDRITSLALHPVHDRMAALAPAGAISDALVVLDGDRLVLESTPDAARRPVSNFGASPLADVSLRAGPSCGLVPRRSTVRIGSRRMVVVDGSGTGRHGRAAHEEVCRYAAERRAFGGIIGGYQGVAHPLADDATNLDGARLLVQKAAWALDIDDTPGARAGRHGLCLRLRGRWNGPPTTPSTSMVATASCSSTTPSFLPEGTDLGAGLG